jgi:hypothetical protein
MRPFLALLTVGLILGGLQLYLLVRPQRASGVALQAERAAAGTFTVEVTLTFDAGPDEFALDSTLASSLLVQLRGQDLLRSSEPIAAGQQIKLDAVVGVVTGNNEFYVQATPKDGTAQIARAIRVRILRNGTALADQTLWAEPGELVQGAIIVEVPDWAQTTGPVISFSDWDAELASAGLASAMEANGA